MKMKILFGFVFFLVVLSFVSGNTNIALSDQGTGVRIKSTGATLTSGDITISIYDNMTGGNLIYSETFTNGIRDGRWNVMLGENPSYPLRLIYGKKYYRDYSINGVDVDFRDYSGAVVERQFFYSPLGGLADNKIVGFTNSTHSGNIINGSLIGYVAANQICNLEFPGSHFCLKSEILSTIASGDYNYTGYPWFQNGPPGYTANSNDCNGWITSSSDYLGPFWNWE
ncbi:MAG TPA: hypothetical protein VJ895_02420, partial [Candidatus Nanoarchaeia archaeon]|nr:hypothetical protein [Candidatus Nanoarchaeia archaeon]